MMLFNKLRHRKVSLALALLIIDSVFFGLTDPARAPSGLFIVAFLLASATIFWAASSLYKFAVWYGLPFKHQKRAVISVTAVLMAVVALQSTGQLSSRDIVIVLPFAAISYFYISYQQNRNTDIR